MLRLLLLLLVALCYTDCLTCCSHLFAIGFQDSVACRSLLQYVWSSDSLNLLFLFILTSNLLYLAVWSWFHHHDFIILCLAAGILFRPLAVLLQGCLLLSGRPGTFPLSRSRTSVKCASYHELSHNLIFDLFFPAIKLSWSGGENTNLAWRCWTKWFNREE